MKKAKDMFEMAKAVMGKKTNMVEELLPMAEPALKQLIDDHSKPESEGGWMPDGDTCIGLALMPDPRPGESKFVYLLVSYRYDPEKKQMCITKKASLFNLQNEAEDGK